MTSKPFILIDYFNKIIKKYHELHIQTQKQDLFRIVNIKTTKKGEYSLQVQLINKATFFECTPQEIVTNDQLLEGFSKKDIRTITYYAAQDTNKPKYKILIHEFREGLNKVVFKLGKDNSEESIEKTAEQISLDQNLINQLNCTDAHLIGYTTASEFMLKEKAEMERLKEAIPSR